MAWTKIPCKINELRLDITLACGQSFRWQQTGTGEWTGVLAGSVWTLRQDKTHLFYKVHGQEDVLHEQVHWKSRTKDTRDYVSVNTLKSDKTDTVDSAQSFTILDADAKLASGDSKYSQACNHETILEDYFQLQVSVEELYKKWALADDNFKTVAASFNGVRILRQDPVENLFSFICSSNNNIARISKMVERLSQTYGQKLLELDDKPYHSFPTIESLASPGVEETLRGLGFGYRAKFISQTASYIAENHSNSWLFSLREQPYEEAKAELMKLCGVGAKVADCVCLMSLDKTGAIPVDTHVWQIAARDYLPSLKQTKSLTNTTYKLIGDHFRSLYGEYAGWAHSVLFSADLKRFQDKKSKKRPVTKGNVKETTKLAVKSGAKKKRL